MTDSYSPDSFGFNEEEVKQLLKMLHPRTTDVEVTRTMVLLKEWYNT